MTLFLLCMFSLSNYTGDCDLEAPFWLACTHHTIWTISCAVLLKCYLIRTDPYHACNLYALCFIDIMQCGDVMSDAWCLLCDGGRRQGLCTRLPAVWRGSWDLLVTVSRSTDTGHIQPGQGGVTTVLQGGHRAVENRNLVATLMDQYHIVKTMSHVWRPVW